MSWKWFHLSDSSIMDNTDKAAWGQWLQSALTESLAGTGLRPEVEYLPPVYEEDWHKSDDGSGPIMKKRKDSRYSITIICPLEWKVTNIVPESDISLKKVQEIIGSVLEFYREAWPERICTDYMYDIWKRVPGFFDWLTEMAPHILYRVTMQQLTQRYGSRAIKGITMYEDMLVVHTRWAGDFNIGIDNYRKRLEEVAGAMQAFMRKPLRFQYLYQLRHGKNDKE